MTRLLAAVLLVGPALLAAGRASAADPAAGTGGAAFLKIGIGSARAQSMGRAYVALAEGSEALTWNPAGLALAQQRELGYSYMRYIQDIDAPLYMGYAHPLGRTVVGANLAYLQVDGFDVRDASGKQLDGTDTRVQNGFSTIGVARSFWYEKLFLGGSLKGIHEDNAGTLHDVVVGDFGALFKPNSYVTFGFAQQNFGAGHSRVAAVTRGGVAFRMFEVLTTSMELSKASDNSARVGLGGEFILPEDFLHVGQVALRMGYYSADNLGTVLEKDRHMLFPLVGSPRLTFGIGLYSAQAFGYGISFDYALVSLGSLGTSDQMSLKVRF